MLREGLLLAAAGAVLGTAATLALARLIQGLLYGIGPSDPATIFAVVLVSMAAAAAACYLPAQRATRVDPVEVLRAD